jgi:inosose dehydratase
VSRPSLEDLPIGVVPILWNNVDLPELSAEVPFDELLMEFARLGFDGCQYGSGFPSGPRLRHALDAKRIRLAEVYAALPCDADGPTPQARDVGQDYLDLLLASGGEVLVAALQLTPDRVVHSGRAHARDVRRVSPDGIARLAGLLNDLGAQAANHGARLCFHQHAGTYIETPDELAILLGATNPSIVGVCLDTGHYILGGGEPAEAIAAWAGRIQHVHLKDVALPVLERLRDGRIKDFRDALRERIFTELGNGVLPLDHVLQELTRVGYQGWLMLEQDTAWGPPSESAAISRRVLERTLKTLHRDTETPTTSDA